MSFVKAVHKALCAASLVVFSSTFAHAQDAAAPEPVAAAEAPAAEAPAAATPAATEAPLGEAKIESGENPYGIGALWAQGDFV